jgi:hypothetical protein
MEGGCEQEEFPALVIEEEHYAKTNTYTIFNNRGQA